LELKARSYERSMWERETTIGVSLFLISIVPVQRLLTVFKDVPSMAVDPDYHGQGIAGQLLQKLCELPDEAGQDIYLESTIAARTLYKNAGFEVLGELEMLEGEYMLTSMLRKPKQST
jgi:GNAT superfamily N-acetyltransferase